MAPAPSPWPPAWRLALIAAVMVACGGPAAGGRVVGRGTLGYAVGYGGGVLCTIELDLRFALHVRDQHSGDERARFDLGPPERDLVALAIADGVAYVGGVDQQVRAIDLGDGHPVAAWPHGAAVSALAIVAGGWLAIGDREGALCLRRRGDGALIQCVDLDAGPIERIRAVAAAIEVDAARGSFTLRVPALTLAPRPRPESVVRGHAIVVGGRTLARFAGAARAVAWGPDGRWAAVGWVRDLDDPSVIVAPSPSPARRH